MIFLPEELPFGVDIDTLTVSLTCCLMYMTNLMFSWCLIQIKCCGIDGYKDWNKNVYFNCTKTNPSGLRCGVPYSCCKDPDALSVSNAE